MNCPVCGKPIEEGQNFCRDCGAQLTERPRISRLQMAGLGVIALMFTGLMLSIFGKMFEMRWLAYLGLAVLMTGAFVMAAYGFIRETRPRKRVIKPQTTPVLVPSIEKADTTNKLLPIGQNDFVPSVVENTTDLLEPVGTKKKKTA